MTPVIITAGTAAVLLLVAIAVGVFRTRRQRARMTERERTAQAARRAMRGLRRESDRQHRRRVGRSPAGPDGNLTDGDSGSFSGDSGGSSGGGGGD